MEKQIIDRFPGISCAWADAGGKEGTACFGLADRENRIPVDENIIFPACSVSKFATALCIMKLQERGAVDIDMPVNRYLRQWKLRSPDGKESEASVRAVLSHTAGILDGEDAFYGLRCGDPEITLMDILEGKTFYNSRPVRPEKPQGTDFVYSDAGYCVLQLLVEEVAREAFDAAAQEILFGPLGLKSTFFAAPGRTEEFEGRMAAGYDDANLPIPGRFLPVPDLAASGLWSTPKELLAAAEAFMKALHGEDSFLQAASAREMAKPAENCPWTGLGVFREGEDILLSQGWGENGQCMLKMDCRTGEISVVMTNRNPGVDQKESGIQWLADRKITACRNGR